MHGNIFTIAGSDPSGGAGIQADIKTISALGGYAMAAITALTVQNTQQVHDVHLIAADIVAAQIKTVLDDIPPDAVKLGMLGSQENLSAVFNVLKDNYSGPLVMDPVVMSTSGYSLLEDKAIDFLVSFCFPLIDLITPNLSEAELLSGEGPITTRRDMIRAGEIILSKGVQAVLIKGGHLSGDIVTDILITHDGFFEFSSRQIPTRHTHGTGCALASAIATGLGQGMDIRSSVEKAHHYVHKAIASAPEIGHGNGPLNHFVGLD